MAHPHEDETTLGDLYRVLAEIRDRQPTLRDLIAMHALGGMLADPNVNPTFGERAGVADAAYAFADVMLKARGTDEKDEA